MKIKHLIALALLLVVVGASSVFDCATSSKVAQNGARKNVQSIKNTATLRAEGINVSVSDNGVSGSTGSSSSTSLSWTNRNSWISDISGRGGYTGLVYRVTVNSAAFAIHHGEEFLARTRPLNFVVLDAALKEMSS